MTVPLPARLDEIEAALAKGSKLPWGLVGGTHDRQVIDDHGCHVATTGTFPDAALIVAAVNALPGLLAVVRDLSDAIDKVRGLHRPWYEINGVRHDHTVMANCEDFDGCDGTADRDCDDAGEHERLACVECRHVFDDMDGNLFWPCPTARAVLPADHGQNAGEGR